MNMPKFDQYVEDFSSVLSLTDIATLRSRAEAHNNNTTEQAVTVLFPNRNGYELADIGLKAFRENGIGQKSTNNGILLLIATQEKKIRIVTGYGMESKVPDTLAKQWIENDIRPKVNKGDYAGAVWAFYDNLGLPSTYSSSSRGNETSPLFGVILFIIFVLFLPLILIYHLSWEYIKHSLTKSFRKNGIEVKTIKFDSDTRYLLKWTSTNLVRIKDPSYITYEEWDKDNLSLDEIIPYTKIFMAVLAWSIAMGIAVSVVLTVFFGTLLGIVSFFVGIFVVVRNYVSGFVSSPAFAEFSAHEKVIYNTVWLSKPSSSSSSSSGWWGGGWGGWFSGGGGSSGGGGAGD